MQNFYFKPIRILTELQKELPNVRNGILIPLIIESEVGHKKYATILVTKKNGVEVANNLFHKVKLPLDYFSNIVHYSGDSNHYVKYLKDSLE